MEITARTGNNIDGQTTSAKELLVSAATGGAGYLLAEKLGTALVKAADKSVKTTAEAARRATNTATAGRPRPAQADRVVSTAKAANAAAIRAATVKAGDKAIVNTGVEVIKKTIEKKTE